MRRLRTFFQVVEWVCVFLLSVAGAAAKTDPSQWSAPLAVHLRLLSDWSLVVIGGIACIWLISKILQHFSERSAANREEIKNILNILQKNYFPGSEDQYKN